MPSGASLLVMDPLASISLARVLDLGVALSPAEVVAIALEAAAASQDVFGDGDAPELSTATCWLNRSGFVEFGLGGTGGLRGPDAVVALVREMVPDVDPPVEVRALLQIPPEHIVEGLEVLASPPRRRRVEIASVAIRACAAEAELARRTVDALVGELGALVTPASGHRRKTAKAKGRKRAPVSAPSDRADGFDHHLSYRSAAALLLTVSLGAPAVVGSVMLAAVSGPDVTQQMRALPSAVPLPPRLADDVPPHSTDGAAFPRRVSATDLAPPPSW